MIPTPFAESMISLLGSEQGARLIEALEQPPTLAVRFNPAKPYPLPPKLAGEPVEWWPQSARLPSRPQFTLMPELHAGAIYVQDPASMIIARLVKELGINEPLRVLDACAAPGGKSTAMLDALPAGSMLVSNEYDPRRAQILLENVVKWGHPNVIVTQGDTARPGKLRNVFDIIVIDAPCSGEGMMRKEPMAAEQWSPGLIASCAALQQEIIDNLWPALRPGGLLIYSTCTFNLQENEEQAQRVMELYGAQSMPIELPGEYGIGSSLLPGVHALRFMPHLTRSEGLFVTLLRKPGEYLQKPARPTKQKGKTAAVPTGVKALLRDPGTFSFMREADGLWHAISTSHLSFYKEVAAACKVLSAGVNVAMEKGRDLIPQHALALSTALNPDALPALDISREEALTYLRREPLTLPPSAPRGHLLLRYSGLPIGLVKNLGNRSNNLYPQNWRIKHL